MVEDMVNRLEKEMGLLDFQNNKVMHPPVSAPPREAVSLRQALAYSGVVYLRGGRRQGSGGQAFVGGAPAAAHSAVSSFPSLATSAALGRPEGLTGISNQGIGESSLLDDCKVKLCRSEMCCPWSGQVRHARHVAEKPVASLPPNGASTNSPEVKAAAVVVKPVSSCGSVWSNNMPIPPRLASAVVSGSTSKLKVLGQRADEEDFNNNVKTKGGSVSNLSTKAKKRSLGRFNSLIKKKGKQNK